MRQLQRQLQSDSDSDSDRVSWQDATPEPDSESAYLGTMPHLTLTLMPQRKKKAQVSSLGFQRMRLINQLVEGLRIQAQRREENKQSPNNDNDDGHEDHVPEGLDEET